MTLLLSVPEVISDCLHYVTVHNLVEGHHHTVVRYSMHDYIPHNIETATPVATRQLL